MNFVVLLVGNEAQKPCIQLQINWQWHFIICVLFGQGSPGCAVACRAVPGLVRATIRMLWLWSVWTLASRVQTLLSWTADKSSICCYSRPAQLIARPN
jgi:hypothetical protein